MKIQTLRLLAAFALSSLVASPALSQPASGAIELPEQCRGSAPSSPGSMMQNMQDMMSRMDDAQKAYMQAMMRMDPPMMQAIMANKDPDVAFVCAMVAHHSGAIEMSQAVLKHGKNPEAKKMADKTIKEQEQEITEMKSWLQKNAKK